MKNDFVIPLNEGRAYRIPMTVTTTYAYLQQGRFVGYAVCPRCKTTLEREYQRYCDRCGQALDWHDYSPSWVVYILPG